MKPPIVISDYKTMIAFLAESRRVQGVTTTKLADRIGDHEPNISRTLRGHQESRGSRLFALAHALGYDLALIAREDTA